MTSRSARWWSRRMSRARNRSRSGKLGKLLKRVESGASEGIVAFKLSRFGRGALETLQAVERIRKVGGRLVTVEDGVDSATPGGRLLLTVLAGLAEEELEQRRSGWAAAPAGARARRPCRADPDRLPAQGRRSTRGGSTRGTLDRGRVPTARRRRVLGCDRALPRAEQRASVGAQRPEVGRLVTLGRQVGDRQPRLPRRTP